MKNRNEKQSYKKDLPPNIFNWILLAWLVLLLLGDWITTPADIVILAPIVFATTYYIFLASKGSNIKFYFNQRTDSDGWVVRTGKTLKIAMKKLAYNYPRVVKKVKLKDSTFRVTIIKKYKYHPNPISIEELD